GRRGRLAGLSVLLPPARHHRPGVSLRGRPRGGGSVRGEAPAGVEGKVAGPRKKSAPRSLYSCAASTGIGRAATGESAVARLSASWPASGRVGGQAERDVRHVGATIRAAAPTSYCAGRARAAPRHARAAPHVHAVA